MRKLRDGFFQGSKLFTGFRSRCRVGFPCWQVMLAVKGDLSLCVCTGTVLHFSEHYDMSAVATSAAAALSRDAWHYVEMKVTIHGSTGHVEVHVDGVEVIHAGDLDTQTTANATVDSVSLRNLIPIVVDGAAQTSPSNYVPILFDDFYICDASGAANNDFLGDVRVEQLLPDGAGNYAQFDGVNTGTHVAAVDEAGLHDGDTTYIYSPTVDDIDTFTCANLSTSPATVLGVQACVVARKDDASSRSVATVIRHNSTDAFGTGTSLGDTYVHLLTMHETAPDASAWDATKVNACEVGAKVTA
jgi:hypothetical protein